MNVFMLALISLAAVCKGELLSHKELWAPVRSATIASHPVGGYPQLSLWCNKDAALLKQDSLLPAVQQSNLSGPDYDESFTQENQTVVLKHGKPSVQLSTFGSEKTPVQLQAALQLDLSFVKYRLEKHSWDSMFGTDVDRAMIEYRKFLALIAIHKKTGIPMVPSKQVDEVWHAHILHTREYGKDTRAVAGFFIHHRPTTPDKAKEPCDAVAYKRTLALYESTFGMEPDPVVWPRIKFDVDSCDECGAIACKAQCPSCNAK